MPNRKLNVFLCHAKEDKPTVRELYRQLNAEGWMDVWLDAEKLLPGQEWDIEIEKAVERADVVLVCLSTHSVDKEGYVQKELRFVLNIAEEKPEGTIFVVPLRLDDCQVPRRIRAWQWVDYFPKNQQKWAYQRLLESLKLRATKFGISIDKPTPPAMPVEDEFAKAERERKAQEERERLAAQEAENERIARQKTEADRAAKAERDGLAHQKAEERRKAIAEAFRKMDFKSMFIILGIMIATTVCFMGGKFIVDNLPSIPTPTQTSEVSKASPAPPKWPTEPPILTPTPELGIGSTWTSPKDGMTMLYIPAGEFSMGSNDGSDDEKPVHTVYLDSFWIDQTEATNAMYAKCVQAGKCDPPRSTDSYTRQSYYVNPEFGDYPVINVSWNDANAYCDWRGDGTRLPTEAEWEKVASWDDVKKEKRIYPWGNTFVGYLLNFCDKNCSLDRADKSADDGYADTSPVGNYPNGASFYGALDMAGNVWEWVADWYDAYPGNTISDSSYGTTYRVLRGGAWGEEDYFVRSALRVREDPSFTNYVVGFRCVRSLP